MTDETYQTKRTTIPEAEALLGKEFKVLDKGFVRLVDYMGGDESIVEAARGSYGKGTKKISEDTGLLRYLSRKMHTTPFEMVELKFQVRVPMDCWRQWIRHRTANVNEYSTRYSEAIDDKQQTLPEMWRKQSKSNKQGSGEYLNHELGTELSSKELEFQDSANKLYRNRLEAGVAREQARKDLPLSTYTEAYWKIDLHNLLHFLYLRMDSRAQWEIRQYANVIGNEIVKKIVPITWQAFEDYTLNSVKLSKLDRIGLEKIIKGENPEVVAESIFENKRERLEFLSKISTIIPSR